MIKLLKTIGLVFFLGGNPCAGQGLLFQSNNYLVSQRTSFDVFAGKSERFDDSFSVHFELSVHDTGQFGHILRVYNGNGESYGLVFVNFRDKENCFIDLEVSGLENPLRIPLRRDELKKGHWFPVGMFFDMHENVLRIAVDGKSYDCPGIKFSAPFDARILFGKHNQYIDVPAIAIRNLKIESGRKEIFFPLDQSEGSQVSPRRGHHRGRTENPVWLINRHYRWSRKYRRTEPSIAATAYDSGKGEIHFFYPDNLKTYDTAAEQIRTVFYPNPIPVNIALGTGIFNPAEGTSCIYEMRAPGKNIVFWDHSTGRWSDPVRALASNRYHHHNSFIYPSGEIGTFGGYGTHRYYNDFLRYDSREKRWEKETFSGEIPSPRFFSSMAADPQNARLYIFGGCGNPTGRQELGEFYFYDCFRVDLKNRRIEKLWENPPAGEDYVPAGDLILDEDGRNFYALCYPKHKPESFLRLYRFDLSSGRRTAVSDSIPITSEKIQTYTRLFYSPDNREFYCVINEYTGRDFDTRIYSLAYPPLDHIPGRGLDSRWEGLGFPLAGVILLSVAVGSGVLYRSRRKKRTVSEKEVPFLPAFKEVADTTGLPETNCVRLLGEFRVKGASGEDITHLFTPKIQQLFILILLSSSKPERGVSTQNLSSILWPEKTFINAKNIRGVTIKNLKTILTALEGISLVNDNGKWSAEAKETFFCDYLQVTDLIRRHRSGFPLDERQNEQCFEILRRGLLLPSLEYQWLEPYKLSYEQDALVWLKESVGVFYKNREFSNVLIATNLIYSIDNMNRLALRYELKTLRKLGRIDQARKHFEAFVQRYRRQMKKDFGHTFEQIVDS